MIEVVQAFLLFFLLQFALIPVLFVVGYAWMHHIPVENVVVDNPEFMGWLNVFGILITAACLFAFFLSRGIDTIRAVWQQGTDAPPSQGGVRDILYGASMCFLAYPLTILVEGLTSLAMSAAGFSVESEQVAVKQIREILHNPFLVAGLGLCVCVVVPLVEELLFRGFLQQWVKKYVSLPIAIILTSCAFALVHYSREQGMSNVPLIISLFVLSCFLGYIRERRGSLWASIGLHSFFNLTSTILLVLTA